MDYKLYPISFKQQRLKTLVRDDFKCIICIRKGTPSNRPKHLHPYLVVSHIDQNKDNCELSNLQTLCPTHHALFDAEYKKFKRLSPK